MSLSIINPFVFAASGGGPGGETKYGIASWSSPGTGVLVAGRFGWVFTVGASDLSVDRLRHYGRGANAAVWRVMIHRNSDNAVIAQADITKAEDAWAEELITPATLTSGVTYTISGRAISGDAALYRNPTGIAYASEITLVDDGVFGGSDDNRPTSATGNAYVPPADFGFVVL